MLLRPTRLALLSALACAEPPKDGPPAVDTDRAEPTPDDTPTPDARDTSEEAPPPVDTAGLPTCEQLGDACLMSGEWPGPCGALRDACRDAPWSEPCVDAWFTCLAGDRPVLDCRLDLLTCLTAPPPAPDDGCATAFDDCLAQGRDADACAGALDLCLAPPVDTAPPADTDDPCAALRAACVDPAWCPEVLDACLTWDPGDPCVDAVLPCLAGPDPGSCGAAWDACVAPPPDTGPTCRDLHTDCLARTGSIDGCALVLAACHGQDPDPTLACSALGQVCLDEQWPTDCVQAEADCNQPSACRDALTTCLADGGLPSGCAADWRRCP